MMIRSAAGISSASAAAAFDPAAPPPMLATPAARLPRGGGWAYEFKWDGMRAIAVTGRNALKLTSRTGRDVTAQFPELRALPRALGGQVMMLDGELVALVDGRPSFSQLQPRMYMTQTGRIGRLALQQPVAYLIFDVLQIGREDLTALPYRERRSRLERLALEGPYWSVPPMRIDEGAGIAEAARQMGLEGVIAKRLESPYRPGVRSPDWVKVRLTNAQEFVIGGWRPSRSGQENEVGSLAVGYHADADDPRLTFAGFVGSGFSQQEHRRLMDLLHEHEQKQSPFAEPLPQADVRFVQPVLVAHVAFTEWTPQQVLRHPVYKGLRPDKPAGEVIRET